MKILILTGRFGMGHVSAAEAIRQEILLEKERIDVEVIDFFGYIFPKMSRLLYKGFEFLVEKHAGIYNKINHIAARHSDVPLKTYIASRMADLMLKQRPDLVVVTFPGGAQYVSRYKEMTGWNVELYVYITDLTVHREWFADKADLYFVGSKEVKDEMVGLGIPSTMIKVAGIPVKQTFKINEASRVKGYRRNKEVLIMGGGLGLIEGADRLISSLLAESNINITLIAGNNINLRKEISNKFPQINVVGYTNKVDYYMKMADLLVTKSGGMTTFEAVNCHTPMFILPPFLLQEIGNARFVEKMGIGIVAWNRHDDIGQMIIDLLANDEKIELIKAAMGHTLDFLDPVCPLSAYRLKS